ncbi:YggT family protein [Paenibacillus apiarius]|uniref:YggT family protein n=1 Tax=Paenibacillus apiarius TaxID=46240 RepID=A0ABT4DLC3_9BACL|nr:YggT family protein [Paenibacillus apiarius]MBN3525975.1 YggT family protein [Paenibacillus apiarius]MCY9513600.1 YggT family protein [Paenibacillus apiarius]MCY9518151.1 YggT family protein [Paenibacillus apiarius]MCY9551448.1 YggT family protein [Paenibacillus apiarius]MCY9558602.1 YggT family protein [Paenibacillus apiarius]
MEYQVLTYLGYLYQIYRWLIIIYILMSWVPNVRESFVGEILGKIVEPYLAPFRRIIPPIGGMLDISPIVALFTLHFVYMGLFAVVQYIF